MGATIYDLEEAELCYASPFDSAKYPVKIPMGQLRSRLADLPRDRKILVIWRSARRACYSARILLQRKG